MDESTTNHNKPNLAANHEPEPRLETSNSTPAGSETRGESSASSTIAEEPWDRLTLALNRLETAILARQQHISKGNDETHAQKLEIYEKKLQESLQVRRERDALKKVVETTLGDIRALLK